MATHSSVLAWRIPGTAEPGGLPSMGSHRVGHDWSDLAAAAAKRIQRLPSLLNGVPWLSCVLCGSSHRTTEDGWPLEKGESQLPERSVPEQVPNDTHSPLSQGNGQPSQEEARWTLDSFWVYITYTKNIQALCCSRASECSVPALWNAIPQVSLTMGSVPSFKSQH